MKVSAAPDRLIDLPIRAIKIMFYGNQCNFIMHSGELPGIYKQLQELVNWPMAIHVNFLYNYKLGVLLW
jgi:hypothetical protein